jgi:hypothetical protein
MKKLLDEAKMSVKVQLMMDDGDIVLIDLPFSIICSYCFFHSNF